MLNYPFIRALSTLLDNTTLLIGLSCNPNKSTAQPQDEGQISYGSNLTSIAYEFQYTLLLIAESISTNQKVMAVRLAMATCMMVPCENGQMT